MDQFRAIRTEVKGRTCISGSEGNRDHEGRGDPEKYSSYESGVDTKHGTQNLSILRKGEGPKTVTKKLKKSKCTDFTQNREKSFLLYPPTLLPLLSQLGENVYPGSGQPGPDPAELGPAQAHSFHYASPRNSCEEPVGTSAKATGFSELREKNQNPTPCTCILSSKTVQRQTSTGSPFYRILKAPTRRSPGTSPVSTPTCPHPQIHGRPNFHRKCANAQAR